MMLKDSQTVKISKIYFGYLKTKMKDLSFLVKKIWQYINS